MRKRKKKSASHTSYPAGRASHEGTHIRLCHVCLHLSESDNPIVQCQECQRYLTIEPLIEEHLGANQTNDAEEDHEGHGELMGGLNGLSVVW